MPGICQALVQTNTQAVPQAYIPLQNTKCKLQD